MDVREKLAGLLNEAGDNVFIVANQPVELQKKRIYEEIADYLIANGITVQKWISVKDRLPEEMEKVMAFVNGVRITAVLKGGVWLSSWNHDPVNDDVTLWMPLPQPPKGE